MAAPVNASAPPSGIGIGGPTVLGADGIGIIDPHTRVQRREDPEVASQLLKSGQAAAPGGVVKMVRGNEVREVPSSDIFEAEGYGWALTDDVGARAAQVRDEEDTLLGNVRGVAEQGVAGLTMGLSSLAMQKAGVDMERVRARAKGAGEAGEAAQLAGEVLPVLLSGGATAGVKGGAKAGIRAAGIIPRAVEGAGVLAEKGVVSLLGTGAKGKAAGVVTRGILEGAASGVGMEIHESALGDRDIVGERVLASATMAGLFGGAGAGGFSLTGGLLQKGGAKLEDTAAELLAHSTKGRAADVAGVAKDVLDGGVPGAAEVIGTGISGRPKGPSRLVLDRLASGPEGVAQVAAVAHDLDGTIAKSAKLMKEETAQFDQLTREIREETESSRARAMDDMFEAADDEFVPGLVQEEIEGSLGLLEKEGYSILKEYEDGAMDISKKDLDSIKQALVRSWDEAVEGGTAAKSHGALLSARRNVREVRVKLQKNAHSDRRARETADIASKIEKRIGQRLGGEDFGKAGKAWREVNEADAAVMRMKDELFVQSRGKLRGRNNTGKVLSGEATDAEMMLWTKRIGNPRFADQADVGQDFFERQIQALELRAKHFGDASSTAKVKKLKAAHAKYLKVAGQQAENANLADALVASGRGAVSGLIAATGPSGAAVVGGLLGGAPGAAVGAAANLLARPAAALKYMAALMAMGNKAGLDTSKILKSALNLNPKGAAKAAGRMGTHAGGFAGSVVKAAGESVSSATPLATRGAARLSKDDEREARHKRAVELTMPDALTEAIAPRMGPIIRHAPGVAGVISERISVAAAFLADKMPPKHNDPLTGETTSVDDATAHAFDRYYEAVSDPLAALKRLEDGSFTVEHAEAIREVWPAIYADAQEQVFEGLQSAADDGRKIPYQNRAALGILLDIPTDITMTSEFLQAMSAVHGGERAREAGAQAPPQKTSARTRKANMKSPASKATTLNRLEQSES